MFELLVVDGFDLERIIFRYIRSIPQWGQLIS